MVTALLPRLQRADRRQADKITELANALEAQTAAICGDALKLIKPNPEHRAQCEEDISRAYLAVRMLKVRLKQPSVLQRHLCGLAKKLRTVEADAHLSTNYREQTKRERERIEAWADKAAPPKASPRSDAGKRIATHVAHVLLMRFGSRRPGVTLGGSWHKLAALLYETDVDLFTFSYLRKHQRSIALPENKHIVGRLPSLEDALDMMGAFREQLTPL
jgi:hypothetical protein